jgi:hypothetical protein
MTSVLITRRSQVKILSPPLRESPGHDANRTRASLFLPMVVYRVVLPPRCAAHRLTRAFVVGSR